MELAQNLGQKSSLWNKINDKRWFLLTSYFLDISSKIFTFKSHFLPVDTNDAVLLFSWKKNLLSGSILERMTKESCLESRW